MARVAIAGASGYTGIELLRILLRHPGVEVTAVTSEKHDGRPITDVFPGLTGATGLVCRALDPAALAKTADLVFTALPHGTSMEAVGAIHDAGKRVVDLSADFRLRDRALFEATYGPHSRPDLLGKAVYGVPELHREAIGRAALVANPGCYPMGAILALAPLLREDLIEPNEIIVDAKSGVSGAGRGAVVDNLFSEVSGSVKAYKVGEHRHMPEIEQALSAAAGNPIVISFTPHLIPMDRGILSTIYVRPRKGARLAEAYEAAYKGEPFVRVLPDGIVPATGHVLGSNLCFIGYKDDPRTGRCVIVTAIDNLVKGASGVAVQNMNLMLGLDETAGLTQLPLFP
ncbi:MAG: N-acetyl-gamma-glutamyl-phosphate reductase [Deltaproteobacteria bacterium]|nr:N-acetyl-gamma-glutamyl-phosphate reductase [Deltaproteobacteria bacterium]